VDSHAFIIVFHRFLHCFDSSRACLMLARSIPACFLLSPLLILFGTPVPASPPVAWFGTPGFCCFLANFWARRFSLRFALTFSCLRGRGASSRNCCGGAFVSSCGASLRERLNLFASALVGTFASAGGAALLIIYSLVYIQSDTSIDADESGDRGGAVPLGVRGGGGGGDVSSGGGGGGIPAP
jgi:hypothetical protein